MLLGCGLIAFSALAAEAGSVATDKTFFMSFGGMLRIPSKSLKVEGLKVEEKRGKSVEFAFTLLKTKSGGRGI